MNVLVIAPHADDETLGCGGLIARRAAAGAWVHVAVLGLAGVRARGDASGAPTQVEVRGRELKRACDLLGVQQVTALYPEQAMRMDTVPLVEVVTALDGLLDEREYDEVYLPYASVNHDHQVAYRAMLAALRPALGRKPVPLVAAYEYAMIGWQPEAVPGGKWYVDIGETLDIKLAALQAYATQVRPYPHPCSPEAVLALARFRGMEAGVGAAELFYLLRKIE